jgi:hypothetical protein
LWTPGKGGPSTPPFSSTGCGGTGWEIKVPWCPHHQQTIMVQTHQASCEEGTTKLIPPQETEKIWHGSLDPQKVIQLHHREHGCITAWYGNCSASDHKALHIG